VPPLSPNCPYLAEVMGTDVARCCGYRLSSNTLVARTAGLPIGVKMALAVTLRSFARLSSRRPADVRRTRIVFVPAAAKLCRPEATSKGFGWAFLASLAPAGR